MTTLSVLMPVFNEARTLRTIVPQVLASPVDMDIELICVDDRSTDDSLSVLEELAAGDDRIRVIAQPENMGKGRSIRTAIDHMTGDIAIIQDADLEYDPKDYPKVLAPLSDGRADAVYGSRFAASEQRRVIFFWHSLGNRILTLVSNMVNDLNLTDMETCYKAVRADWLRGLRLTSDRFGLEPEITARLAQTGARIYEVPISYHGRTYAEGKKIGWRDGVEAMWLILKFRFFDTRHVDDSGHVTLENLAGAPGVSRWMIEQFRPYLGESVMEAGCGSGNLTVHLIDRSTLHVVDIDPRHVASVTEQFGDRDHVSVSVGDLEDPVTFNGLDGQLDSVLCVNVLEHLGRPEVAMAGFARVLKPGGHCLLLVPAHQWLYSAADEALGHHKRYEREDLVELIESSGFQLVSIRAFNRLGVLGWMVNKVIGRTTIGRLQAKTFEIFLPFARMLEHFRGLPGLSWVAIGRKS